MRIEIIGPECARCDSLHANARAAVEKMDIECRIVKISDPGEIARRNALTLPTLVIDDKVRVSGKDLSVEEIVNLLR